MTDAGYESLLNAATGGRISRRELLRRATLLGLSAGAVAPLLEACGGAATPGTTTTSPATRAAGPAGAASASATTALRTTPGATNASPGSGRAGVRGGTLKVALVSSPPTFDIHQTSGTIVSLIAWEMFEPLFTWDSTFKLIPMLAESHEVSSDGLSNVIRLRKGVPFHDGSEMKAADVVASIKRWATLNGLGANLMAVTDTIRQPDDYTLEFMMKEPFGVFAPALAMTNQGCAIYPRALVERAGKEPLKEFIGTGPYKFVEYQPDRLIRLARFDSYAALPGEPQGYGGHKYAYFDRIDYTPVPDEAARIAGVRSGDYHYLESVTPDQYPALRDDPVATAEVLPPGGWAVFILNLKKGPLTNLKLRQAIQKALDLEPILVAGQGKGFYRLDPALMLKETVWYADAGKDVYNHPDAAAAKRLLQEAGYDGTPLRFSCTQQYQDHYNRSVVAKQQLEAVGFKVDLLVYDWATVLSQQKDPDKWDITTTGIAFKPDPAMMVPLDVCNFAGWWCNDDTVALVKRMRAESDFQQRYDLLVKIQQNFYSQIPEIKVGDTTGVIARSRKLQGLSNQTQLGPILWNAWLST